MRSNRLGRTLVTALAGSALAFCTACGPVLPKPTCPSKGGAKWTQVSTSHFVLKTDLSADLGQYFAVKLEAIQAAMEYVLAPPKGTHPNKVEVVLLDRTEDFYALVGTDRMAGFFASKLHSDVEPQPVIAMYRGTDDRIWSTFQHELAHRMTYQRSARVPIWLSEGLAEYYSTLVIGEHELTAGAPLTDVDFWERSTFGRTWFGNHIQLQLPASEAPSLGELFEASYEAVHGDAMKERIFYTGAWKLVHMLKLGPDARYRARFRVLQDELERGDSPEEAVAAAFDGASLDELERAYRAYLIEPSRLTEGFAFEPPAEASTTVQEMSDAEVHLLWARLRPWNDNWWTTIRSDLDAAEAEGGSAAEVHYRRAIFWLRQDGVEQARSEIQAALKLQPAEPRFLLVDIATEPAAAQGRDPDAGELGKLVTKLERFSKLARSPVQRAFSGAFYAAAGQTAAAEALLGESIRDDPTCGLCYQQHATFLFDQGRLDSAWNAVERAFALTMHERPTRELKELRQRIRQARQLPRAPAP